MTTTLWWVRRDLRLADNQALASALASAGLVLPVFVLDPALLASPYTGPRRLAFLLEGLRRLDADLRARDSYLVLRHGRPEQVLAGLAAETGAATVFAEADYSPYARRRDSRVAQALNLHLVDGLTVFPPGAVRKADGRPYTVFTPFSRAWQALPLPAALLPAPLALPTPPGVTGQAIPAEPGPWLGPFEPGEAAARRRLAEFTSGAGRPPVYGYDRARDRLDRDGTARLSPYLRFGMLSARQAAAAARAAIEAAPDGPARAAAETWLNELIWREFYLAIMAHFPDVRRQSFRPAGRTIAWQNDRADFAAWCAGQTGYPVVDAAMRCLAQTGWLHNRARMIAASFLVKDLLIDWRWGERWFMQQLIDGDPAANNGGWQWVAGTGTDAAPYFRIFNPTRQGQKFDPAGDFVRQWLPELGRVPPEFIHTPWQMPAGVQRQAGCRIGQDYPRPIVDHAWARQRTLAAYKRTPVF